VALIPTSLQSRIRRGVFPFSHRKVYSQHWTTPQHPAKKTAKEAREVQRATRQVPEQPWSKGETGLRRACSPATCRRSQARQEACPDLVSVYWRSAAKHEKHRGSKNRYY
jgi:hypothetical protein